MGNGVKVTVPGNGLLNKLSGVMVMTQNMMSLLSLQREKPRYLAKIVKVTPHFVYLEIMN